MRRDELEGLERDELLAEAERAGVARPEVLTRDEILDAIEAIEERAAGRRDGSKSFLQRVRHIVAAFVEKGLNLPQAAERIRTGAPGTDAEPLPVATVTLAEIYAAQGHTERALSVLDQVLQREPDHAAARRLRARLLGQQPPPQDDDEDDGDESADASQGEASQGEASQGEAAGSAGAAPPEATAPTGAEAEAATEQAGAEAAPEAQAAPEAEAAPDASAAAPEAAPAEPAAEAKYEAPKPKPILDEEPLPERYDVDELVLMPVDPTSLYFYWEVRESTLDEARTRLPGGTLRVRLRVGVFGVLPWIHQQFDVPALGDYRLYGVPAGSMIAGELGLSSGEQWLPLVQSRPCQLPAAHAVLEPARRVVRWTEEASHAEPQPSPGLQVAVAIQEALVPAAALPPLPMPEAEPGEPPSAEEPEPTHLFLAKHFADTHPPLTLPREAWPLSPPSRPLGSSERMGPGAPGPGAAGPGGPFGASERWARR